MRKNSLWLALVLVGCGGSTSATNEGTGPDASSDSTVPVQPDVAVQDEPIVSVPDASPPPDAGTVPGRNPECPVTVPAAGDPCKPILACDYASDQHHVCVTHVDCASSDGKTFKWFVSVPADGCGANNASCPASFTALANGAPCPGTNPTCTYPEGRCGCLPCSSEAGISSMWACRKWGPADVSCPPDAPLSGDACSMPNQLCSYGGFCGIAVGPSMQCEGGYWRRGGPTGSCALSKCGAQ